MAKKNTPETESKADKKAKKTAAPVEQMEPVEAVDTVKKGKKAKDAVSPTALPLSQIVEIKGFNPRHVLQNIDELAASFKKQGVLSPILVRPHATKANVYELLDGHRRFKAAEIAKLSEIPIFVRADLSEISDALLAALTTGNGQLNPDLNSVEQAHAFKKLEDEGVTVTKIAFSVGVSSQHIRNCLALLDAPKDILDLVASGDLAASTATTIAKLEKDVQAKVLPEVTSHTTAADVKALVNKIVKEEKKAQEDAEGASDAESDGEETDDAGTRNTSGGSKKSIPEQGTFKLPKTRKEVSAKLEDLAVLAENAESEEAKANILLQVAALLWASGDIEDIRRTDSREFKKAYKALVAGIQWDDEGEAEAEEEKPAKAEKKGKKAKAAAEEQEEENEDEQEEESDDEDSDEQEEESDEE